MAFPRITAVGKVFYEHLQLSRSQIEKGTTLADDQNIFDVIEHQISDKESEIIGFCLKRSSFTSVRQSFRIDSGRRVIKGSLICSCDFGVTGNCPHVVALIVFINF